MVSIGALTSGPASISQGADVSGDGSVIVGNSMGAFGQEAFRWTAAEGMQPLGDLPGGNFQSRAHAVSADGSVVVGEATGPLGLTAFVWDSTHGMRSIADVLVDRFGVDLNGFRLLGAEAVSADGLTIVGVGINELGHSEAWVVRLPEPSTLSLLLLSGLVCGRRRLAGR
jgi:uncharacterized membrane protein